MHGGVMLSAVRLEASRQGRRQELPFDIAGKTLLRGAGKVGRQIDGRQIALDVLFPIGESGLGCFTLQPRLLPDGEVSKLKWQLGQRRLALLCCSLVKRCEVAHQDAVRPSVAGDVMNGEGEVVIAVRDMNEADEESRSGSEIDVNLAMLTDQCLCLFEACGLGQATKIGNGEAVDRLLRDD